MQGRMHVLAGKVANISVEDAVHCEDGCSALQRRLQRTAGTVAVHCVREGQNWHRNRQSYLGKEKREENMLELYIRS